MTLLKGNINRKDIISIYIYILLSLTNKTKKILLKKIKTVYTKFGMYP